MRAKLSLTAALLASCTHGAHPADCAVDAGTDAMAAPWVDASDVDRECAWFRPEELTEFTLANLPNGWLAPFHLGLDGTVAHVDFVGPYVANVCESVVRYRVALDGGVVALTDHACADGHIGFRTSGLCRVNAANDVEVHAILQPLDVGGVVRAPVLRVLRHSTGEILFTFGEGLVTQGVAGYTDFVRGEVRLAPERSSDPACCPSSSACRVGPCGSDAAVPDGCRWEDRISEQDGFCHAVVVF